MKLLNIKTYTDNYTKKKVPVIPPKTLLNISVDGKEMLCVVQGIIKSKPTILSNKYEYIYIIQKFGR